MISICTAILLPFAWFTVTVTSFAPGTEGNKVNVELSAHDDDMDDDDEEDNNDDLSTYLLNFIAHNKVQQKDDDDDDDDDNNDGDDNDFNKGNPWDGKDNISEIVKNAMLYFGSEKFPNKQIAVPKADQSNDGSAMTKFINESLIKMVDKLVKQIIHHQENQSTQFLAHDDDHLNLSTSTKKNIIAPFIHSFLSHFGDQDDSTEVMLMTERVVSECYHCPPAYQRVLQLNETNFEPFVHQNHHTFVLFWLKYDTLSRAVLPKWAAISTKLPLDLKFDTKSELGAVSCSDWPNLCNHNGVETWPVVMIYRHGLFIHQYKGDFEENALLSYISLHRKESPIPFMTNELAMELEQGNFNNLDPLIKMLPFAAVTTGYFHDCNSVTAKAYKEVARRLQGRYLFYIAYGFQQDPFSWKCSAPDTCDNWNNMLLTTYRPNDPIQSRSTLKLTKASIPTELPEFLIDFVKKSSRPVLPELNAYTVPLVFMSRKPLVLLVGSNNDMFKFNIFKRFGHLALTTKFANIFIFCHIKLSNASKPMRLLMKMWDVDEVNVPSLVLANTTQGTVHRLDNLDPVNDGNRLENWLNEITEAVFHKEPTVTLLPLVSNYTYQIKHDHLLALYGTPSLPYGLYNMKKHELEMNKTEQNQTTESISNEMELENNYDFHDEL